MYAYHKQLHPPTSVQHCLCCNLVSQHEGNLVVAGASQIRVYRLTYDKKQQTSVGEKNGPGSSGGKKPKLELVCKFQLFGNVVGMQAIRIGQSPLHSLLLSFGSAKVSLVQFDPTTHDLKTIALHYFEDPKKLQPPARPPIVRSDPDDRCAAALVDGSRLAIMPFLKEKLIGDVGTAGAVDEKREMSLASYVMDL